MVTTHGLQFSFSECGSAMSVNCGSHRPKVVVVQVADPHASKTDSMDGPTQLLQANALATSGQNSNSSSTSVRVNHFPMPAGSKQ
jgi:hypothetical protein